MGTKKRVEVYGLYVWVVAQIRKYNEEENCCSRIYYFNIR